MKGISVDQLGAEGARIADQFRGQTPALSRLVHGQTPVYTDAPAVPRCHSQFCRP